MPATAPPTARSAPTCSTACCWHCSERLWATTAKKTRNRHGTPITTHTCVRYRARCLDRGNHDCPTGDASVAACVIDEQVAALIKGLSLPADWQAALQDLLATADERRDIERRRAVVQERLRRAGRAYADGNRDEAEYERRKREAEAEMASLSLPAEQELLNVDQYLQDIGRFWDAVDLPTRRGIAQTLFDAFSVDMTERRIQEYRPKAALMRLLVSLGGCVSGDPDGSRGIDCHFHRLVATCDIQRRGRLRRIGTTGQRRLSSTSLSIALDQLAAGASLRMVARQCGVSHETVRRAVHEAGIALAAVRR